MPEMEDANHEAAGLQSGQKAGRVSPKGDSMAVIFRQAGREARITLALYAFFFVWWTVSAFWLGAGDPREYSFILGMPAWFFMSCVAGYVVISLLLWVVLKHVFTDAPLADDPAGKEEA